MICVEGRSRRGPQNAHDARQHVLADSERLIADLQRQLAERRAGRDEALEEMQTVLDQYLVDYNTKRSHQGRGMNGRAPITTFIDGIRKEDFPEPSPIRKTAQSTPARAAPVSRLLSLYTRRTPKEERCFRHAGAISPALLRSVTLPNEIAKGQAKKSCKNL